MIETIPKIKGCRTSVEAAQIKRLIWLKVLGLTKDTEFEKALTTIAFKEEETFSRPYLLQQLIQLYIDNKIKETFGLTLKEYLELPIEEIELLAELSIKAADEKAKKLNNTLQELENE